jgi:Tol biopolymer transport system component
MHGLRGAAGAAVLCALTTLPLGARAVPLLADGTTERVSLAGGSAQVAHGGATSPAVSANGRWVAFVSADPALAPDCPGKPAEVGAQVYLRDRATGRTTLVSATPRGCASGGGGGPGSPSVSADGRYVAYVSAARDIVPGFAPKAPTLAVYVLDRARHRTVAVSAGYDGRPNDGDATAPSISADGRYVAFESDASNIVRDDRRPAGNGLRAVYVRDLATGRTQRVGPDVRARGHDANTPSISGNGRYVAFASTDSSLVPNAGYGDTGPVPTVRAATQQVYVADRVTGRLQLASMSAERHLGNDRSELAGTGRAISDDGRYVAFTSYATNLLPGDVPWGQYVDDQTPDVYLYDRVAGGLVRVSRGPGGQPAADDSGEASVSGDGRWVGFVSGATNLGDVDLTSPGDGLLVPLAGAYGYDVYVYDRVAGTNRLESRSSDGVQGDLSSAEPVLSRDGSVVAFTSGATNLVGDDTNGESDVFAHVRHP